MKKRYLFKEVYEHTDKKQISLIVGARQVGKTTLMEQLKNKYDNDKMGMAFYITLEDPDLLSLLNQHPNKLFEILPPLPEDERVIVLIDEIQYLSDPSNFLKYHYDLNHRTLKLIVSGSSSFYIDQKFSDSLAGRKRIFEMPTLSFEEMLYFRDRDKLVPYINSGSLPKIFSPELNKLWHEYMLFGGYPEVVIESNIDEKQALLREIAESYVKKDALEARLRYPDLYLKLFMIIGSQTSLFNATSIGTDLGCERKTVESYIHVMDKSFHITKIKPFYRNVSKELRKMAKLYFNDLGLRNYFLNDFSAIAVRSDKGELFENYVFRRFSDHYMREEIRFWRTQKGQEVDFIIKESNAYEVKYNKDQYNPKKYEYFKKKYTDFPFHLIHSGNVLEITL